MADNVTTAGTTVAADELTINSIAVQVQRTKQVVGPDGTYVGDVSGRWASAAVPLEVYAKNLGPADPH